MQRVSAAHSVPIPNLQPLLTEACRLPCLLCFICPLPPHARPLSKGCSLPCCGPMGLPCHLQRAFTDWPTCGGKMCQVCSGL